MCYECAEVEKAEEIDIETKETDGRRAEKRKFHVGSRRNREIQDTGSGAMDEYLQPRQSSGTQMPPASSKGIPKALQCNVHEASEQGALSGGVSTLWANWQTL